MEMCRYQVETQADSFSAGSNEDEDGLEIWELGLALEYSIQEEKIGESKTVF